ncbi:MAG TPA: hemin uptake protein HemP [Planctomycetes bacterium]|nr:hemin uptake protein HemP [Fuerstiella sp.]HIK94677.1 hemin uptake protein HemP [Planctomycetota bacterium]
MTTAGNEQSNSDSTARKPDQRPSEVSFHQLSEGRKEVVIEHDGKLYRLRLTRKGGLILN